MTQFKHQLTLQDQLEVNKDITTTSPRTTTSWTTNPQVGQNMTLWSREMPVLYHGHFAHFNLRKLGLTTSPIYINLIRWGALLAKSVLLSIDLIDMMNIFPNLLLDS